MNTTPDQRADIRRSAEATLAEEAMYPPTERMPYVRVNAEWLIALFDDHDAALKLLRKVEWRGR